MHETHLQCYVYQCRNRAQAWYPRPGIHGLMDGPTGPTKEGAGEKALDPAGVTTSETSSWKPKGSGSHW